jgi:hypothetical protein
MDLLEHEMKRRRQRVPDRPTEYVNAVLSTDPAISGPAERSKELGLLSGVELMDRLFRTRRRLETDNLETDDFREAEAALEQIEAECQYRNYSLPRWHRSKRFPVTPKEAPELAAFRNVPTGRLRDLMSQNQHEVMSNAPDTVTHQDGARDMYFIGEELRRRGCA